MYVMPWFHGDLDWSALLLLSAMFSLESTFEIFSVVI